MSLAHDTEPQRGAAAKSEAWAKIYQWPTVTGCGLGDMRYISGLFGGFWHFVDNFPRVIHDTYTSVPAAVDRRTRRFLERSAKILSGTLAGMETDERVHRALWIRAANQIGMTVKELASWTVVPEVNRISEVIGSEVDLYKKLLYFVAVEVVAEGLSRYLIDCPAFAAIMGKKGMGWFNVHIVHAADATPHEQVAYDLAERLSQFRISDDGRSAEEIIQEGVDLFGSAAHALYLNLIPASEATLSHG